jgi:hypothetical protein
MAAALLGWCSPSVEGGVLVEDGADETTSPVEGGVLVEDGADETTSPVVEDDLDIFARSVLHREVRTSEMLSDCA